MPWEHVFEPTLGLKTQAQSTGLPKQATPYIKGCKFKDGAVESDTGMVNFPAPGNTKSNALLGSLMKIHNFVLLSGTAHLLAFTTRYLYHYNSTTDTWDVVQKGTLIDNAESAWDAQSNVTSTADTTIKIRNTASAKHVIASAFTTGIVSSEDNLQNTDISGSTNTHLSFWIYSDTDLASDVLRLRLSEQSAGGTGATYADYTIPALTSGEWQHVSVAIASPVADDGGTYPDDLNSLASVALIANSDPGAVTIYLDDIRTAQEFTGDEDNRFSITNLIETLVVTNGVDAPFKITSGPTHEALTLSLSSGAITTSEVVLAFKDHVLYMNNTENAADTPQRVSWTNIGTVDDLTGGTAGFEDLVDNEEWILAAAILSRNEAVIYKEHSIVLCTWVGGFNPFRFKTMNTDVSIFSKESLLIMSNGHVALGPDGLYAYAGGKDIQFIDDDVKRVLYDAIDRTYEARTFIIHDTENDEIQFWVPVADTIPDEGYTHNLKKNNWHVKCRSISGFGYYETQTSLTIGDLVGTIGEQNFTFGSSLTRSSTPIILVGDDNGKVYKLDEASLNNAGVAIPNEIQSIDFVLPDRPEYMNMHMRIDQLKIEASGQSVTCKWSGDGGLTFNATQGAGTNTISLSSVYNDYQQDFEANVKKIRFQFTNSIISSGFKIRYFGFHWKIHSGRH